MLWIYYRSQEVSFERSLIGIEVEFFSLASEYEGMDSFSDGN